MPKRVFFPLAFVIMGLIILASNIGLLPRSLWELWPLFLIIVGLGGLLLSDKEEWDTPDTNGTSSKKKSSSSAAKKSSKKTTSKKSTTKKSTAKKSTKKKSTRKK